ncbi:N/A [soil metagenome]
MKILNIIARLNVGGAARHVVWLTRALDSGEFESQLVAGTVPPEEEDMGFFAEANGVEPVYIKEMSRELSWKDAVSLVKVLGIMRRFRPDVVHTHTAKAGTVGRVAAFIYKWFTPGTLIGRPRRIKIYHTFHGHVFHSYYGEQKTRLFILIEKVLARFATDKIIVISQQQFAEINEKFGIGKPEQFAIVPLGIELDAFENGNRLRGQFREEIGVGAEVMVVGLIGRLTEIKNVSMFLEAAAMYLKEPDVPEAKFVIVGDGSMRARLEQESIDRGIASSVVFAGNRTDVAAIYPGLDVVALTSLNEGTPLSLIEAMAAERPVISTMVGGVEDLLGSMEHHDDGFQIRERGIGADSGDFEAFVKGLIYLAKNERLRQSLAGNGKKFVHQKYSKDRLVNDIKALYEREAEQGPVTN